MNYEQLSTKLAQFGVPQEEIIPLQARLAELAQIRADCLTLQQRLLQPGQNDLGQMHADYTGVIGQSLPLSRKLLFQLKFLQRRRKNREEALSTTVIGLLKLYTGKQVLVVWGGARIKPSDPAYQRMVEVVNQAGPGWIVIDGCGPGIMEATVRGANQGGSITIGLRMVSSKAFETTLDAASNPWAAEHTFCFDHHDLYSRVAAFLEYADAVIIGKSGLGGTQEKTWVEGNIQCGMMNSIPIFVFSPDYWQGSKEHFNNMLKAGTISEEDKDLIRFVKEGEEFGVFERIKLYYAARPHLLLPDDTAFALTPPAAAAHPVG